MVKKIKIERQTEMMCKKFSIFVILAVISVYCEKIKEFTTEDKVKSSVADKDDDIAAADIDEGFSNTVQDGESFAGHDEGFSDAETDDGVSIAEKDDDVTAAVEDDRGQCSSNNEGQCKTDKENKPGRKQIKSLYEMFEDGEDKYTPDEWIQALANDDDFHRRVEEDPVFREQIEKELAEMEAENALEDLREEL